MHTLIQCKDFIVIRAAIIDLNVVFRILQLSG